MKISAALTVAAVVSSSAIGGGRAQSCTFCVGQLFRTDQVIEFSSGNDSASCGALQDLIGAGLPAEFCESERVIIEATCCRVIPTASPTLNPTGNPTMRPTAGPTANPTGNPTGSPTENPTNNPTDTPTANPTSNPTESPTANPTRNPTDSPTANPTNNPTYRPTANPTSNPTDSPTSNPTNSPVEAPTVNPTKRPTGTPTANPTAGPTANPTNAPPPPSELEKCVCYARDGDDCPPRAPERLRDDVFADDRRVCSAGYAGGCRYSAGTIRCAAEDDPDDDDGVDDAVLVVANAGSDDDSYLPDAVVFCENGCTPLPVPLPPTQAPPSIDPPTDATPASAEQPESGAPHRTRRGWIGVVAAAMAVAATV